jgi:hypothetical protein
VNGMRLFGIFVITGLLFCLQAIAAGPALLPTEKFDVVWKKSPSAYAFAKRCLPSVSENTFRANVTASDDGQTQTIGDSSVKRSSYLLLSLDGVFCIPSSNEGYPFLPLQAFSETVSFDGLSAEQKNQIYSSLSQQVAMTGAGQYLVQFDNDNAVHLTVKVQETRAQRLYYDGVFLKAGSYELAKYPNVVKAPIKSFVKTTHGNTPGKSLAVGVLVDRPLLDEKYLVSMGSAETTTFEFLGTTWRFPQSLASVSFAANGLLNYKPAVGPASTGEWKLVNGALYFSYGSAYFSGTIEGETKLRLEGRDPAATNGVLEAGKLQRVERRWAVLLSKGG